MSMLNFSNLYMTPAIVKKLMGFKVNPNGGGGGSDSSSSVDAAAASAAAISSNNVANHDKLCETAIKNLVKKLKKTPGALEELERAITTRDPNTRCITIPLKNANVSGDNRTQSRKTLPHVVYCRLWRFADLQNCNELKSIPTCQHGYNHHYANNPKRNNDGNQLVCINPYHYTRCELNNNSNCNSNNVNMNDPQQSSLNNNNNNPSSLLTVYVPKTNNIFNNNINNNHLMKSEQSSSSSMLTDQMQLTSDLIHSSNFMITASPSQTLSAVASAPTANNNAYFNSNSPLSPPTSSSPPAINQFTNLNNNINNINSNNTIITNPTAGSSSLLQQFSPFLSEDDSSEINDISPSPIGGGGVGVVGSELMPVTMAEQPYWCSMSYYEMKQRVGEMFHVASNVHSVTIDGYTDPSSASRFCLGVLSNANRTDEIEMTRRYIGRGVTLHYHNGQVFAECLSENPVFVQSANCNQRYNWHLATVIKIPPGCTLKIFDEAAFVQLANETVYQGFEAVYALTRICSIRISFVKGWGESYRRQTVLNTPCWIELHLNNPLKLVDEVLTKMGSPRTKCTSVS